MVSGKQNGLITIELIQITKMGVHKMEKEKITKKLSILKLNHVVKMLKKNGKRRF
jgi:hypothetical protein